MCNNFQKVKNYLIELDCHILIEDSQDKIFVIENESEGITNMVIGIAEPILILEQYIFEIKEIRMETYKDLLKKNRDIVHGALVLDESGSKVIFRDTLQIENLDLNELQASIQSLGLFLSENSKQIIQYSKN